MTGEIIFLPSEEWEARARREGYWREIGLEEELGDFHEPEHSDIGDCQPMTDEEIIRIPRAWRP